MYGTTTKAGALQVFCPERTAALASIAAEMGLPAVAIGGITADRAPALRDAPLLGICVVADLHGPRTPAPRRTRSAALTAPPD